MSIFSKSHSVLFLIVLLLCCILFTSCKNETLPKGNLKIYDSNGDLIAFSSKKGIEYENYKFADYIETVLDEAVGVLKDKYADLNRKNILKSELEIHTHFSHTHFNAVSTALSVFSFDDGKSAEIAISSTDGKLLASIGKTKNSSSVTYKHKAGSAIKPLSVYAPALKENIINWSSTFKDAPFKKMEENGILRDWPNNYNGIYTYKDVSLKEAIKKSFNTIPVAVLHSLTPKKSCDFLENIGVDVSHEKKYISTFQRENIYGNLALGELKNGISAEEMVAAYQIFANGGNYTEKRTISKISTKNKVIYTPKKKKFRVLDQADSKIINLLLQEVITAGGTASGIDKQNFEIAGKTGTSQYYKDNWFVGITPEYVCAVWYGYSKELTERPQNQAVDAFKILVDNIPVTQNSFFESEAVIEAEYCRSSGLLASANCKNKEMGFFNKSKLPTKCLKH